MSSYYEKILATGEVKCIDEEIPFEIPQGWEWCRMGELISYHSEQFCCRRNKRFTSKLERKKKYGEMSILL